MDDLAQMVRLLHEGGTHTFTALAILAWWWERRDNRALRVKLLELATAQMHSNLKHEAALDSLKLVIQSIGRRTDV